MAPWLSKTDYVAGCQCPLALWLRKHEPDAAAPPDPAQHLRFAFGDRVDAYAHEVYPGGVLIHEPGVRAAASATRDALRAGAARLYQATFVTDWGGCMVDVLDREPDGSWTLREVKAATGLKDVYVRDAAFQTHVLAAEGLDVGRVVVVLLDADAAAPSRRGFFREVDVTDAVAALRPLLDDDVARLRTVVAGAEPAVRVGRHCADPYPCPFAARCWEDVPEASVFTIPDIDQPRLDALLDAGIWALADVPARHRLPRPMRAYVQRHGAGPAVHRPHLRAWSASLLPPIRALTVLTQRAPLPRFDGVRPYQPVPVLVSTLTLHEDDHVERVVHLHTADADPRPGIAEALVSAIGADGHVLTYDAPLIRALIPALIGARPDLTAPLARLRLRLRDLREIVEGTVRHPGFLGSYDLDTVAPLLLGPAAALPPARDLRASYEAFLAAESFDLRHHLSDELYGYAWTHAATLLRLHAWTLDQAARDDDPDPEGWSPLLPQHPEPLTR